MDKLRMQSANGVQESIEKIQSPHNTVTKIL